MAQRGRDRITIIDKEASDGTITKHARFTAPEKVNGKIIWRRIERSTRTGDTKKALKIAEVLKGEFYKKAYSDEESEAKECARTFAEATVAYIKAGGDETYLLPILEKIGNDLLSNINQERVNSLAERLYPTAKPATINRQIFTPIIAILRSAESEDFRPPMIKRPKGWITKSNFKRPPKDWWKRVVAACNADGLPHLAALILFLRLHGRRTSEACRIEPEHIDRETWNVTVFDTKTDQEIVFKLAQPVIDQLSRYAWKQQKIGKRKGARPDDPEELRVFGYATRWSVVKRLKIVCGRHDIPYHVPKDAGRHSFATGLLEAGCTLKEVKEAGRWKTIKVPDAFYSHLEHNKVDDAARKIGEQWHGDGEEQGTVISPGFGANMVQKK